MRREVHGEWNESLSHPSRASMQRRCRIRLIFQLGASDKADPDSRADRYSAWSSVSEYFAAYYTNGS